MTSIKETLAGIGIGAGIFLFSAAYVMPNAVQRSSDDIRSCGGTCSLGGFSIEQMIPIICIGAVVVFLSIVVYSLQDVEEECAV